MCLGRRKASCSTATSGQPNVQYDGQNPDPEDAFMEYNEACSVQVHDQVKLTHKEMVQDCT